MASWRPCPRREDDVGYFIYRYAQRQRKPRDAAMLAADIPVTRLRCIMKQDLPRAVNVSSAALETMAQHTAHFVELMTSLAWDLKQQDRGGATLQVTDIINAILASNSFDFLVVCAHGPDPRRPTFALTSSRLPTLGRTRWTCTSRIHTTRCTRSVSFPGLKHARRLAVRTRAPCPCTA